MEQIENATSPAPVHGIVHQPVPFYDENGITIYNADCETILPMIGKFDVVVTDPPYAVKGAILNPNRKTNGRNHNVWHEVPEWDDDIKPVWCELCCNAAKVVFWFGNWKRRNAVVSAMKFPIRAEIVWAKDTHVGPPCPFAMQDERIWVFSESGFKPKAFDTTVWSEPIIPTWAHRRHKNEKPEGIMRRIMRVATSEGDRIVDPFMGSGTTLVAAKLEGRKAVGIEINEKYCEAAAKRLSQGTLF